jgi:membrane associated rhomboid family serine protease
MTINRASAPPTRNWLVPLVLVGVMWVAEIVDAILPYNMDQHGIRPRSDEGLLGIAAAPFLHGGFAHLIANTSAFVILGLLVVWTSGRYLAVTIGIAVLGGLGVWLVAAPNSVHIGASGLVYGYAAFLVAWGVLTRKLRNLLIAVAVILVYGGIVIGVLPGQDGVSWQGHLFGAIAGAVMAFWLNRRRQPATRR